MPRYKILIVDADADDVSILIDVFSKKHGVGTVHQVNTAMQAFMYLQSIEEVEDLPNLIVTDMYLPGITGEEFLQDLKHMEKYKHLHVLILTNNENERFIEKMLALGAVDYVVKPSTYDEYLKVAEDITARIC